MSDSFKLFRASPEAFFVSFDKKMQDAELQLKACLARTDSISALGDMLLTKKMPLLQREMAPKSWTYVANLPNLYFSDVFDAEVNGSEVKRWVGKSGRISASIPLVRSFQYDFAVEVVNFTSKEVEATFTLKVNGEVYPWLEVVDGRYKTIILESRTASELEFELSVDMAADASNKDVSFSFREISISSRG